MGSCSSLEQTLDNACTMPSGVTKLSFHKKPLCLLPPRLSYLKHHASLASRGLCTKQSGSHVPPTLLDPWKPHRFQTLPTQPRVLKTCMHVQTIIYKVTNC